MWMLWLEAIKGIFAGVILLAVIWGLRPLLKFVYQPFPRLEHKRERWPMRQREVEIQIPREQTPKSPIQIVEHARHDPLQTAQILRQWLKNR